MIYETLLGQFIYPLYEGLLGRKTFRYINEYQRNQWLDKNKLQEMQWLKLKQLLAHCEQHVPYYKELWRRNGISVAAIQSPGDLSRLPLLTKKNIRDNYDKLIADGYRQTNLRKSTGGSTGEPMVFEYTRESYERRNAVMWRGYGWTGGRMGRKTLYLWGGDVGKPSALGKIKYSIFSKLLNRKVINTHYMSATNLHEYVEAINRYKPEVIVSYVAPVNSLAEFIIRHGLSVYKPTAIITGAEALYDVQRQNIKRAFGVTPTNTYGCREFMLIGAECEHHNGLHINVDHLYVETINDAGTPVQHEPGNIVITDLHNYGFPLVRYVNGDIAALGGAQCGCNRGLPLLTNISGRKLDQIYTSDGHMLPGEFFIRLMMDITGVNRFQVIQDSLHELKVKIVKNERFSDENRIYIEAEIRKILGETVKINILFVDEIELTLTGKQRVTISNIKPTNA